MKPIILFFLTSFFATSLWATIPESSLSYEYEKNFSSISGSYSLLIGVQTKDPWLFAGGSLSNLEIVMDNDFFHTYGFDWIGALSLPFVLGSNLFKPDSSNPLNSLFLLSLILTGIPQMVLNPRLEAALHPLIHLTGGYNIDTYVWKEKAFKVRPWLGILVQSDSERGFFHKYGGGKNIAVFELTAGKSYFFGSGYLAGKYQDTWSFKITSTMTF